jgi:hypothetical protein
MSWPNSPEATTYPLEYILQLAPLSPSDSGYYPEWEPQAVRPEDFFSNQHSPKHSLHDYPPVLSTLQTADYGTTEMSDPSNASVHAHASCPIPEPTINHPFDDLNFWMNVDSPINLANAPTVPVVQPSPLLDEPVRTCEEAKEFWQYILHFIENTWKRDWSVKLEQAIKDGHAPKPHEMKQALQSIDARLASLSVSIYSEDPTPLQDLLDKVKEEGSQATEVLKNFLCYYAGNNVESIRSVIQGLLQLLTSKRFLGDYDEDLQLPTIPSQLLAQCVLVRSRSMVKGSTSKSSKPIKVENRNIGYKVSPCPNPRCKYCTQEKTNGAVGGWRSRQDVMVCLVSSLLRRSPWICPAWYVYFSTPTTP